MGQGCGPHVSDLLSPMGQRRMGGSSSHHLSREYHGGHYVPPDRPYDAIIVDLFDPSEENEPLWNHLLSHLHRWTHTGTSVVLYTGEEEGTMRLTKHLLAQPIGRGKRILSYDTEIPCFEGECSFLLIYGAYNGRA